MRGIKTKKQSPYPLTHCATWDGKTAVPPILRENPVAQTPLRQVIPQLIVGNSESGSPARGNGLQHPPSLCTRKTEIFFRHSLRILYIISQDFSSPFRNFFIFSSDYSKKTPDLCSMSIDFSSRVLYNTYGNLF